MLATVNSLSTEALTCPEQAAEAADTERPKAAASANTVFMPVSSVHHT